MKKIIIAYLIGTTLVNFPLVKEPMQKSDILRDTNPEARQLLEDKVKREEERGKNIWDIFWNCDNISIDSVDPNDYIILPDGTCKYQTPNYGMGGGGT